MDYKEATTEAKALSTFVGYMADTMSKTQAATAFVGRSHSSVAQYQRALFA
jgi:hypothetical protein